MGCLNYKIAYVRKDSYARFLRSLQFGLKARSDGMPDKSEIVGSLLRRSDFIDAQKSSRGCLKAVDLLKAAWKLTLKLFELPN